MSTYGAYKLMGQSKTLTSISGGLSRQSKQLAHQSKQLEYLGKVQMMIAEEINNINLQLTKVENFFLEKEIRDETWGKMRGILIDLKDTVTHIEEEFETSPIYSAFSLEVVEEMCENAGLIKENFREFDDQMRIHEFRKKVKQLIENFQQRLTEKHLSGSFLLFKNNLEKRSIYTQKLSKLKKELKNAKKDSSPKASVRNAKKSDKSLNQKYIGESL